MIKDDLALVSAGYEVRSLHLLDPLLIKQSLAVNGDVEAGFGEIESQVVRMTGNDVLADEFNKSL